MFKHRYQISQQQQPRGGINVHLPFGPELGRVCIAANEREVHLKNENAALWSSTYSYGANKGEGITLLFPNDHNKQTRG